MRHRARAGGFGHEQEAAAARGLRGHLGGPPLWLGVIES